MTPSALFLGLFIGIQHALEPDHLAAVATSLPKDMRPPGIRTSITRTWLYSGRRGFFWGAGHGLAIMAVGVPLVLLGIRVPSSLEEAAELVVGGMLIFLGVRALAQAVRLTRRAEDPAEESPDPTRERHPAWTTSIGLVHGLAGSGATVLLASTTAESSAAAIGFLLLFVVGSIAGMAAAAAATMFVIERWALQPLSQRRDQGIRWVFGLTGSGSIAVGIFWSMPAILSVLHA